MMKLSTVFLSLSLITSSFAFANAEGNAGDNEQRAHSKGESIPLVELCRADIREADCTCQLSLKLDTIFRMAGDAWMVGHLMPSITLIDSNLGIFNTGCNNGKIRIYIAVSSVETLACEQQTGELAAFIKENIDELGDVEFIIVSADTPFAQHRFIENNNLRNSGITFLSDYLARELARQRFITEHSLEGEEGSHITFLPEYRPHDLGYVTSSQTSEFGLLARAIIVVDQNNRISQVQLAPDLTAIPDIKVAIEEAKITEWLGAQKCARPYCDQQKW